MNKEQIAGKLDVIKGRAKRKMGKVTSNGSLRREGVRDELVGRAKQGYGSAKRQLSRVGTTGVAATAAGIGVAAIGSYLLKRRRAIS